MNTITNQPFLLVEDSDEDFFAFERIFRKLSITQAIYRCSDGEEALDFLYHRGQYSDQKQAPRPSIILLDLNLPGIDGRDVLAQIKQDSDLSIIPVVVFTTSSNPKDVEICYQQGVNSYIIKPINVNKLMRNIQLLMEYWFEANTLPNFVYK
ncbi:response regulator [Phormidium sp. LEGE 05292]|uniref:response regulator n=1 Tax=[Phormidium] sp. LEGE 05292 TaxID=767427 RepID=UPI0018810934|nr:response regulator [Phormidium sp. LEGE 05292]MBE9228628.1 response regulator [Phormidium sp. LEGE 05292]